MEKDIFDLEHIKKTYFKMAMPVVMSLIVTLVYNLADTFFIAQTKNTDLVAAVSLCSPIFTALMAFGNIYGQGGSSLLSRMLGLKDLDGARRVSSFSFYIAIITGVILGALMILFRTPLLHLLGAQEQTISHASQYYTVMALGAPALVLTFIHSNLLRCEGLAAHSMVGSVLGTVLNIILDPILISVFHLGAFGAAVATVIGYLASDIFFIFILKKYSHTLSISWKDNHVSSDDLKQIFGVGITAAITNLMSSAAVIVLNQFLLPYGSESIAAMGIVLKINMIAQLVLTGFAFGGVPLYGYLYGSGNTTKFKELTHFCMQWLGSLAIVLSVLLFFGASNLARAFFDVGNVAATASVMLRWQVVGTLFAAVVLLTTVLFQATGKIIPAFIMSVSRQGIVFIIVLIIAVSLFGYNGILVSQAIADCLSAVIGMILYTKSFLR